MRKLVCRGVSITVTPDPHAHIVQEGRDACLGKTAPFRFITDNPYPMGTVASEKWREGWYAQSDEMRRANPRFYRPIETWVH